MLTCSGLHTYIEQFHILQGVDLEVKRGELTVLLGRNGAGKTTTLRTIMGLNPPARGKIEFEGEVVSGLPTHVIARRGIGYVPEDAGIFTDLTVLENLRIAVRKKESEARKRMDYILELFPDLFKFLNRKAGNLSGGQKQMLSIGRALVNENKLLLIDEPSKGLAPVVVNNLVSAINEIKKHTAVLLVEQNLGFASRISDKFYIIDNGKTALNGNMPQLLEDRGTQRQYMGVDIKGVPN